ncbi:MAG: hypothetical protein HQ534_01700 [Armatimonadetes bacterium]|nr:hypothetical protein [Armatimonadota bacterium]
MNELEERESIIKRDLDYTSEEISKTSRYIGFGLIGIFIALIDSTTKSTLFIFANYKFLLLISAVFGCLTVISDFLQYIAGNICSEKANKRKEKLYKKTWFCYRVRNFLFWLKLSFALTGAALLIFVIIKFVFES